MNTKREEIRDVVYRIECEECDASYVGQTKRQLITRIKEHKSSTKPDQSKISVVSNHILQTKHRFDWNNTRVLDIEHNYYKRLISEMLHIKHQKNQYAERFRIFEQCL